MRLTKRLRWRLGFARVVRSQLRTGRPPEVAETYARLRAAGLSRWRARRLLTAAYEAEVAAMILEQRVYDHVRYLQRVAALPDPPRPSLDDVPSRQPRARLSATDERAS